MGENKIPTNSEFSSLYNVESLFVGFSKISILYRFFPIHNIVRE